MTGNDPTRDRSFMDRINDPAVHAPPDAVLPEPEPPRARRAEVPSPEPALIGYRDRRDDAAEGTSRARFAAGLVAGVATSLLLSAGCFALLFAIGASYMGSMQPPLIWGLLGLGVVLSVVVAIPLLVARRYRMRRRWSGFLVGVLIGLGIGLLAVGPCFFGVANGLLTS